MFDYSEEMAATIHSWVLACTN